MPVRSYWEQGTRYSPIADTMSRNCFFKLKVGLVLPMRIHHTRVGTSSWIDECADTLLVDVLILALKRPHAHIQKILMFYERGINGVTRQHPKIVSLHNQIRSAHAVQCDNTCS